MRRAAVPHGRGQIMVVVAALLFGVSAAGCTKICGKTPEKAAESYLNAFFRNDLDAAWNCTSVRDKESKTRAWYDMIHKVEPGSVVAQLVRQADVRIEHTETQTVRAVVVAAVTMPRIDMVLGDMLGFAFISGQAGMTHADFNAALSERYLKNRMPRGTNPVVLFLVKENNDWKVYHGWEMEKAAELERWEKYQEAFEIWKAVDAIIPDFPAAQERLAVLDARINSR